jgi:hypothetical protein
MQCACVVEDLLAGRPGIGLLALLLGPPLLHNPLCRTCVRIALGVARTWCLLYAPVRLEPMARIRSPRRVRATRCASQPSGGGQRRRPLPFPSGAPLLWLYGVYCGPSALSAATVSQCASDRVVDGGR